MAASKLAILARLGAMFERTASVRTEDDLQCVLEDVCRTIAELLGYEAVVVNVYRPAFDDMLTAAAVGSDESIQHLVGRASPADTWYPLLADRFERRGAYFVPGEDFDWDELGVETYIPQLEPTDDPDAWQAEDALFVPLHDSNGGLIGVVSVDEPETGRRPADEELDALVAIARNAAVALRIAQGTADDVQHHSMLEGVLEVSARLRRPRSRRRCSKRFATGSRTRSDSTRSRSSSPRRPARAGPGGRERLGDGCRGREPRHDARGAGAPVHGGVRRGRLLPAADRSGRGPARGEQRQLSLRDERPRARTRGRGTGCSCPSTIRRAAASA